MNIYFHYFDYEAIFENIDELVKYLDEIPDINVTSQLIDDIHAYMSSDMPYPRRYKIRPRTYFILIKTTATSLEVFKAYKKREDVALGEFSAMDDPQSRKEAKAAMLAELKPGWYYCSIMFKRVVQIPETSKFQYQDTSFSAFIQEESGIKCYERIIEHLKNRQDVDLRSQFPSARGDNFTFTFYGDTISDEDIQNALVDY